MDKTDSRLYYLDLLRIYATLCVLFVHVSATLWNTVPVSSFDWKMLNFYNGFNRCPIALFIMITGCTFGNPVRNVSLKKIFVKNILRMITAFIFWSIFLNLIYPVASNIVFGNPVDWENMISNIILGPYHFWYIYMIIGIYLIIPFLRKITADEFLSKYFIILGFIFAFLLPTIQFFIGESILDGVLDKMSFHLTLGYSMLFVLGYYLNTHEIHGIYAFLIYLFGILGMMITLANSYITSLRTGEAYGYFNNLSVFLFFPIVALFVFFKNTFRNISFSPKAKSMILLFSNCSFGVYLMQYFIMSLLMHFGFSAVMINPIVGAPIFTLTIFIISCCITYVIKKIPIIGDWIC